MIDINLNSNNDFIDSFSIDLEPGTLAPGLDLEQVPINGIFGYGIIIIFRSVSTVLSFQLECQPGFIGESCVSICTTDPCSNNGTCIQSDIGFTCVCMGDFTGDTCETRIKSTGTTTATVTDSTTTSNNVTDATTTSNNVTDATTTSNNVLEVTTTSSNSNNSKLKRVFIGAVGGSIITFVIINIIIITVLLRWRNMAKSSIGNYLHNYVGTSRLLLLFFGRGGGGDSHSNMQSWHAH